MRDVHVNLIILIDTLSRECNFKYIRTRIELFYTRLLKKMVISLTSNIISLKRIKLRITKVIIIMRLNEKDTDPIEHYEL